nr:hypothetical protein [Serratia liquefaciens]
MYIPRPAKLLFQHDGGWSRYLDKHGDTLSDWRRAHARLRHLPHGRAPLLLRLTGL